MSLSSLFGGSFGFEYPLVFLLLALFVLCAKFCAQRARTLYFPHVEKLLAPSTSSAGVLSVLKWLGIVGVVIALASPVTTKSYKNNEKDGRDIVLILDASESMKRFGFDKHQREKTIFGVAKEVLIDFIDKRQNDRIGLVTFADFAFIASPLTFERDFLKKISAMQRIGHAGKRTAINDAIVQSFSMLNKSSAKSKIAILLTDGVDNMSKVSFGELKGLLGEGNVTLYTIGIGRANRDYNAAYLEQLANAGNGKAYAARSAGELNLVYEEINALQPSKIEDEKIVQKQYHYTYPLFVAILSFILFLALKNARGLT